MHFGTKKSVKKRTLNFLRASLCTQRDASSLVLLSLPRWTSSKPRAQKTLAGALQASARNDHSSAGRPNRRPTSNAASLGGDAGSAFRGSAEQDTRGRHGPVHVEAAHRRLFGAIPACLSPPPPACDRCSSSSPLATSYCTSDGAAPAGPPNTRPTDSSSHVELVLAAPGAGCVGLAPLRGFPCKTWP